MVVDCLSIDVQLPKLSFLWNGEDIPSIISTNGSILSIPQSGYYSNFLRVCESVQNIGPLSLSISSFIEKTEFMVLYGFFCDSLPGKFANLKSVCFPLLYS